MRTILLVVTLALLAIGCGASRATMSVPDGFGRVDGKSYDFRAATPSGIVVAARVKPNKPRSDLGFWASAVDMSLARKGYVRVQAADVKSTAGLPGKLLKYDTGAGLAYWVAVFASRDSLVLAEATGDLKDVDASAEQLERALLSARVN
jgi:hypothetical protein